MKKLYVIDESIKTHHNQYKESIVRSYENLLTRIYCTIRFRIIPLRFLESIAQFIPPKGCVLDMGCGFGLFTLYFAMNYPDLQVFGVDLSGSRIEQARISAEKLGVSNAQFLQGNVTDKTTLEKLPKTRFEAVVCIDLLHHLSKAHGEGLVENISRNMLNDHGKWIIKDVSTRPRAMLWFTYLLDLLLNPNDDYCYRHPEVWKAYLNNLKFVNIQVHDLWDILPYPHYLLIAEK